MRVIAGKFKGTKLVSPQGKVRPTTDLVKGSLFSVLTSRGALEKASCLDVFCGSGALGIEALSRGAESCVFIDADASNVRANLQKTGISATVMCGDFRRELRRLCGRKFDIVFCDPPYSSGFASAALELIVKYGLLSAGGIAAVEYGSDNPVAAVNGLRSLDRRSFGAATYELYGGDNDGDICG